MSRPVVTGINPRQGPAASLTVTHGDEELRIDLTDWGWNAYAQHEKSVGIIGYSEPERCPHEKPHRFRRKLIIDGIDGGWLYGSWHALRQFEAAVTDLQDVDAPAS